MKIKTNLFFVLISSVVFLMSTTSCVSTQKVVYFKNLKDTAFRNLSDTIFESVIQNNDLLSISVSSLNPEATVIFNTPNAPTITSATTIGSGSSNQTTGYLVSKTGNIQFPILGNIRAAGLTKTHLTENITALLLKNQLLVDPIVNIRFLNFRVTVLGEVARPNVLTVPSEKISILEALGLAGDLTIYARRESVLLIREENDFKVVRHINLNSAEIFSSPYYYLKSNDIVYAEPNAARISAASNTRQLLPVVLSGLSFIAIILTRVL
ncbi:MAG: polysaccharide biosynthesis/export family protein [Ferruginibacter sp.]